MPPMPPMPPKTLDKIITKRFLAGGDSPVHIYNYSLAYY